ncbi:MAG: endonuclease III [Candidatus Marinimicrobia bacterium]|nr:endonuclease III [Candidatus Neomarinimicrobiota bacterium]
MPTGSLDEKKRTQEIFSRLKEAYPEAQCSLKFVNPRELLISTILSAQCTDKRVNQVTPALFAKYPTAKAFAEASIEELKDDIRSTGFYNHKAKSTKEAMKTVVENFGGEIPDNIEDLLKLEGVGRKTANVVLGDAFGIPGIVVDTHVKRLSVRLGLTKNVDPVKIEHDLMEILPKKGWTLFGHLMIYHGRSVCTARKPKCSKCFLNDICPSVEA